MELIWTPFLHREALIDEIVFYAKATRSKGLPGIEPMVNQASHPFLRESLLLGMEIEQMPELKAALEIKLRQRERQGEVDAKTLEVAGGFAPTIGVLGTVVGLIDVMRQFSNISLVAAGIGAAFVSTIYGLGLANLILLPIAHRIRARVAEAFEIHELIVEGLLCLHDGLHPALVRDRLQCFLREGSAK